jgi:hypothetical protein
VNNIEAACKSTEIAIKYTPASGANCAEGALLDTTTPFGASDTVSGDDDTLAKTATDAKDTGCFKKNSEIRVGGGATANTNTLVICADDGCTASASERPGNDNIVFTKKRNMKGFSTDARKKMGYKTLTSRDATGYTLPTNPAPLEEPMYVLYSDYWGSDTYANDIVYSMKGEACTTTADSNGRSCVKDFCKDFFCEVDGTTVTYPTTVEVRREIIKKSSAYITTWMYVIHEYEDAIYDCTRNDLTNNNNSVHATDEAMAFYTGTLEGQTGFDHSPVGGVFVNKIGYLAHQLADKRCKNFATCTGTPENDHPSKVQGGSAVNKNVAELAQKFASQVTSLECNEARETLRLIEAQMTVPLVQGTIRYAYKCSKIATGAVSLKSMAEGAVFWMAIAPQVDQCNPAGAATIQAAMMRPMTGTIGSAYAGDTDTFKSIMTILQGCYEHMGITCADVGGLIEAGAGSPAKACTDPPSPAPATNTIKETTNDMPAFILPAIIVLALLLAVFLGFCVHARAQANHFKVMYDQFAQAGGKATPGRRV